MNFKPMMTVTGLDMNRNGIPSGRLLRSFAVWSAWERSSHFPARKLVPTICLDVVSGLL